MFSLFKKSEPLLDEASVQWLVDCYAWALKEFDARVFREETVLVQPNDRFFPGRVDSIDGMANLIFDKVKGYAGVAHWPTRLLDGTQCPAQKGAKLLVVGDLRGSGGVKSEAVSEEQRLQLVYDPAMVNNPEAMIASLSHQLASHLATMATSAPPGGEDNWLQTTEVLAVFLGFGLLMANSAFNVRLPKCGSCAPQPVDRQSYLSQYDVTYALAIFTVLKGIDSGKVVSQLKKPLRGFYKRAVNEFAGRADDVARLRAIG